uniref:Homogentisate 1,2-dioxygenase n=1 Tax=Steinernema glaseri TaxID=37863 RepID=A0A1I8AMK5_9BILA
MHIGPGNYSFCTYHPGTVHTPSLMEGHDEAEGFAFVVDFFEARNGIFHMDFVCFREKFNFPIITKLNKAIFEEMFRCVCATDLCNDPRNFAAHVNDARIKFKKDTTSKREAHC